MRMKQMRMRALGVVLLTSLVMGVGGVGLVLADEDDDDDNTSRNEHEESVLHGGEVSFHIGAFAPRGDSDQWDFNEDFTTQDTSDFDDVIGGIGFATHVNPYFDIGLQIEYYRGSADVRYQNIFAVSGRGLRQDHELRMLPIDVSFKVMPLPRELARGRNGQTVSRPLIPYFGGGVGAVPWDYKEEGKFVDDVVSPTVSFNDKRRERGIAPSAHAFAGVEIQFNPQFAMYLEGRYRWAKDDLGDEFDTHDDNFDMSGGQLVAGMSFRF